MANILPQAVKCLEIANIILRTITKLYSLRDQRIIIKYFEFNEDMGGYDKGNIQKRNIVIEDFREKSPFYGDYLQAIYKCLYSYRNSPALYLIINKFS